MIGSPLGNLFITLDGDKVVQLEYGTRRASSRETLSSDARRVCNQIAAYFRQPQYRFDLAVEMRGTVFQKRVWQILTRIPPGKTRTYGQIAAQLCSSARAVGNACRQNPIPLIVPCHRVVAQNGLGGFSGKTSGRPIQWKRWLLEHEGVSLS